VVNVLYRESVSVDFCKCINSDVEPVVLEVCMKEEEDDDNNNYYWNCRSIRMHKLVEGEE